MRNRFDILTCLTARTAGLALCLFTAPAFAQLGYGLDVAFKSRYVWRGLTYRNASVIQPDFFLTYGKPTSLFTAGLWTNAEVTDVKPINGIGFDKFALGEFDLWAEYARAVGPVEVAVGWSGYFFNNDQAIGFPADLADTHEFYGRLEVWTLPVVDLRLTGWHDVHAVKGTYFEASVRVQVPAWTQVAIPLGSLILQVETGYSLGQEINENDLTEVAYFEEAGFTHLDLSISTTVGYLALGPVNLAMHAEAHLPFNGDARTQNTKAWGGITFTALGPRCRPERDICP